MLATSPDCLKQKMTITAPYFAFDNLTVIGLKAQVIETTISHCQLNQIAGFSRTGHDGLSMAQIYRLLNNIGACAIELHNQLDHKNYYLTEQARGKRLTGLNLARADFPLTLRAKGKKITSMTGCAKADLYNADGVKLFSLKLNYTILSAELFHQRYGFYRQNINKEKAPQHRQQPQQLQLPPLNELIITPPHHAVATFGPVEQHFCAGHFDQYNALPVDILIDKSIELAQQWLNVTHKSVAMELSLNKFNLTTDELAFSEDELSLSCCQLPTQLNKPSAEQTINVTVLVYVRAQAIAEIELEFGH